MRLPSDFRSSNGTPSVTIVAKARIAVKDMIRKSRSKRIFRTPTSVLIAASMLEADHFFHHTDAKGHPDATSHKHQIPQTLAEEQFDIVRRCQKHDAHDGGRKRADDGRGRFGLRRHRL